MRAADLLQDHFVKARSRKRRANLLQAAFRMERSVLTTPLVIREAVRVRILTAPKIAVLAAALTVAVAFPSTAQAQNLPPLPAETEESPAQAAPGPAQADPGPAQGGLGPAPATAGSAQAGPGPAQAAPAAAPAPVWVHLDGPEAMRLEEQRILGNGDDEWAPMCTAPCDVQVSASARYRLSGGGRFDSNDFSLRPDATGHATVRARGGSVSLYVLGIVGLGTGGVLTAAGIYLELVALTSGIPVGDGEGLDAQGQEQQKQFAEIGAIFLASGAAVGVVGVLVMAHNRHPTLDADVVPAVASPSPSDAWNRSPSWKEHTADSQRLPPVAGVPLIDLRF